MLFIWFCSCEGSQGRINLKYNNYYDLSEQEVVSCSQSYGNKGCSGGMSYKVYEYIKYNNLTFEKDFPYVADVETCKAVKKYVYLKSYYSVKGHMLDALTRGPIDIAMDVDTTSFKLYQEGYYNEKNCKKDADLLNHEMVAVGYGYNYGNLYYIIRNSWGQYWGMNGYAYVYDDVCGVSSDPVEPYEVGLI